jgi:hypothetical protein
MDLTARIFYRRQFVRRRVERGIGVGERRDDLSDRGEIGVARVHSEPVGGLAQIVEGRLLEHDHSLGEALGRLRRVAAPCKFVLPRTTFAIVCRRHRHGERLDPDVRAPP